LRGERPGKEWRRWRLLGRLLRRRLLRRRCLRRRGSRRRGRHGYRYLRHRTPRCGAGERQHHEDEKREVLPLHADPPVAAIRSASCERRRDSLSVAGSARYGRRQRPAPARGAHSSGFRGAIRCSIRPSRATRVQRRRRPSARVTPRRSVAPRRLDPGLQRARAAARCDAIDSPPDGDMPRHILPTLRLGRPRNRMACR
jgi:hypothetical protein